MLCQLCGKRVLLAHQYELVQDHVICKTCYQKPEIENLEPEALANLCAESLEKRSDWERAEALKRGQQPLYQYPNLMIATVLKGFAVALGVISIFTMIPLFATTGTNLLMILIGTMTAPLLIFSFGTCIQLLGNVLYRLENPIKDA